MKVWITGAKGLVGSYLISQQTIPFVATGREIDIAEPSQVDEFVRREKPTHIFNCAAFSAVDPAETERDAAFRSNALGPQVLGRVAKERRIKLLHLSTDYVFAGTGKQPLKETDPVAPCNYYGMTKLEGEKGLKAVYPEACILRTSWIYGSGGKNFVAKLIGLLQTKEELRLVEDQVSRPTYVPDLVHVMILMKDRSGLYQFANAGPTSKYDFALALRQEAANLGFPIRCKTILPCLSSEFSAPAKRPLYSAFDTTKIESIYKPRHWRDTLPEYLRNHVPAPR